LETGSGRILWRYKGPTGSHALTVGYHSELRRFLAIEWPYEKGGSKSLISFSTKTGKIEARFPLGSSIRETFCLGGTHLLSSSGWLIDTSTGQITKDFEFPMKEYPDT
jgi:hypothetical protein